MKNVLSKAAKEYGVSVSELKSEINKAISIGRSSSDKETAELWKKIPCKGDVPTPEEVIIWVCSRLLK